MLPVNIYVNPPCVCAPSYRADSLWIPRSQTTPVARAWSFPLGWGPHKEQRPPPPLGANFRTQRRPNKAHPTDDSLERVRTSKHRDIHMGWSDKTQVFTNYDQKGLKNELMMEELSTVVSSLLVRLKRKNKNGGFTEGGLCAVFLQRGFCCRCCLPSVQVSHFRHASIS